MYIRKKGGKKIIGKMEIEVKNKKTLFNNLGIQHKNIIKIL